VDRNGVLIPVEDPAPPRLVVEVIEVIQVIEVIEEKIRPDKRGVSRQGLTVRLFMILLIVSPRQGRRRT
jgi:hypothetical protein